MAGLRSCKIALLIALLLPCASCAPGLTNPRESVRVTGVVRDEAAVPVTIEIYERCSPHLYVFKRCPGKLLGEARIGRPGPFLVEVDPRAPEVSVFAFRGSLGQEESCAVEDRPVADLAQAIQLDLEARPCSVTRPPPPTGSARAPIYYGF